MVCKTKPFRLARFLRNEANLQELPYIQSLGYRSGGKDKTNPCGRCGYQPRFVCFEKTRLVAACLQS
jgi:hypothetical protein